MTLYGSRVPERIDTEADRIRVHLLHARSLVDKALGAKRNDRAHFIDALLDVRLALVRADEVQP